MMSVARYDIRRAGVRRVRSAAAACSARGGPAAGLLLCGVPAARVGWSAMHDQVNSTWDWLIEPGEFILRVDERNGVAEVPFAFKKR